MCYIISQLWAYSLLQLPLNVNQLSHLWKRLVLESLFSNAIFIVFGKNVYDNSDSNITNVRGLKKMRVKRRDISMHV